VANRQKRRNYQLLNAINLAPSDLKAPTLMGLARYRLPSRISAKVVVARLSRVGRVAADAPASVSRSYLDTADWRLYSAGWTLESVDSQVVTLSDARRDEIKATAGVSCDPTDAATLPSGPLWDAVRSAVDGRRLLVQSSVEVRMQRLALLNRDGKTTCRVRIDRYVVSEPPVRRHALRYATVLPVRGYNRSAAEVEAALVDVGLQPDRGPLIVSLLAAAGRPEPGADLGPGVPLDRTMPAARAIGAILERLRGHVMANEEGVREQLDIEFLHDYRVAIRRARSIVRQAAGILPPGDVRSLARELGWLGGLTGPPRDLDVHLEALAGRTDPGRQEDTEPEMEPLRVYLVERRRMAQAHLTEAMDSERYKRLIDQWQRVATSSPPAGDPDAPDAWRPAGEVADEHVGRAYHRVLKRGNAIHEDTPPEALHDLRKRAKELRYLLECFQTLYPDSARSAVVKELKLLQDNLGEFQDCQVQAAALRTMADDLMEKRAAPAATLMALGRLAEDLERRERRARDEFEARFARFSSADNRQRFAALIGRIENR
jgi:CHAD domain-containing protein